MSVEKLWRAAAVLMLVVFLPVLFLTCTIGKDMNYHEQLKPMTIVANPVLSAVALLGIGLCIFLFWVFRKVRLSPKGNLVADAVLLILFTALYFVMIWVTREIAFRIPWDIMVVRETAYNIAARRPLGWQVYLSIYTNNIPISYILGRLYRWASESGRYVCVPDDIWLQVNCILISAGGYFGCLTVKKLTRNLMAVAVTFCLYLVLVAASPWKMAPYTDVFGIVFPIMCIFFYLCYRECAHMWAKFLYLAACLISVTAGGYIKPSIFVILIAVLGVELLRCLKGLKWVNLKYFLFEVALTAALLFGARLCRANIIKEIGLEINPEVEASWQHYFHMGLNEETTGTYSPLDAGIFGEFQTSKSERNKALIQRSVARLRERGFFGTVWFWMRKQVMTFNDGTFGWNGEVWIDSYYPQELAQNTALTEWLRNKLWPGHDVGRFNTICQLAWLFVILSIPGICMCKRDELEKYAVLTVGFLGIFFYQMLFEARARYLVVFLPLLLAISVCGIRQYMFLVMWLRQKIKSRKLRTDGDGREKEE